MIDAGQPKEAQAQLDKLIANDPTRIEYVIAQAHLDMSIGEAQSAVRILHKPSGLQVFCQEERSQIKNKAKALKLIRTRLFDEEKRKVDDARSAERRSQVGSGDRSARVRTYNFPQNRVTDQRIKGTNYTLDQVMDGKLDPIFDALLLDERERRIAEL